MTSSKRSTYPACNQRSLRSNLLFPIRYQMDKYLRAATSAPASGGAADPLSFRPNLGDLTAKTAGVRPAGQAERDDEPTGDGDGVYVALFLTISVAFTQSRPLVVCCTDMSHRKSHLRPTSRNCRPPSVASARKNGTFKDWLQAKCFKICGLNSPRHRWRSDMEKTLITVGTACCVSSVLCTSHVTQLTRI